MSIAAHAVALAAVAAPASVDRANKPPPRVRTAFPKSDEAFAPEPR